MKPSSKSTLLNAGRNGALSALILVSSSICSTVFAQQCPPFQAGVQVGTVEHGSLNEISGIAVSRSNPGVMWVHNDSGDTARVFAINASGDHLGIYNLTGAQAVDYEDIAIGPGPVGGIDYLYVADTGNNNLGRSTVTVYRVPEPAAASDQSPVDVDLAGVDALTMTFPGTAYDCETVLVDPASGDIYLISRDRDGSSGDVSFIFKNPAPHDPEIDVTLTLITSFPAPIDIKGGDISPDGSQIVLRSSANNNPVDALWWAWDGVESLASVFAQPGCPVPAASEPQGEAIAFAADGLSYFTVSESTSQPIYQYTLATPPAAPTSLTAVAQSSSEISLSWTDNSDDEDGFEIYESLDGTNFSLLTTTGPDATSIQVVGLEADTTYHYFAGAINVAGGTDSNVASDTTFVLTAPTAPASLAATAASSSQIDLVWQDTSDGEDGFRIYESADGSNFTLIFTTGPDATSGMVNGLLAESTYYYFVSAFNDAGESDSNVAGATTLPPGPTTLFSDGFESGDLVSGGWSVVSPASGSSTAAYAGTYGALLKKSAAMTKTIVTGGATTIDISYWRSVSRLNAGEFFTAEYSLDGNSWNVIEQTGGSASWAPMVIQIVPTMSTIHLRFQLGGNAGNDLGKIDEVLVTGAIGTPNTAPVAGAENYVVDEDHVLAEEAPGLLGNDSDADGDILTAVLVDGATSGLLGLNEDGSFTYVADPDFSGTDSFTYIASDGFADSPPTTVTITVNPVPDAPVANADAYNVEPGGSLVIAAPGLLANDADADGDLLTASLFSGPSNGSLSLAADGSFSYVPDPAFTGNDSFVYSAHDGNGGSDNATVMIAVQPSTGAVSMHVNSILVQALSLGKGRKKGYAEVVVVDNEGNPVGGVDVTGTFSQDISETLSATTDAGGKAVFTTIGTFSGRTHFQFCVDDITDGSLVYDADANVESCDQSY